MNRMIGKQRFAAKRREKEMRIRALLCKRKSYSQRIQYLDAIKSFAKDLSLPIFETLVDHTPI